MASESHLSAANKEFTSVTPSDVSFVDEKDKSAQESDDDNNNDQQPQHELERVESSMYPTSFKLVSILVAIMLSMLLVALDMVSTSPKLTSRISKRTDRMADNRRDRHTAHYR
jgi:hypothetical protein